MIKKISIIVAGILVSTSICANAERNPYNEMDAINLSNMTLEDIAAEMEMSVDEFKEMWGLPVDMPGDTNDYIASDFINTTLNRLAEATNTPVENLVEQFKVFLGKEDITGDTIIKDLRKNVSVKSAYLDEEYGIDRFRSDYGFSDDITEDTPISEVELDVNRLWLLNSTLLSYYQDYDDILVMVKGKYIDFDVAPVIENDRVLVPMRNIFETLGAEVYWQGDVQTVIAVRNDDTIAMQLGQNFLFKNNEKIEIPTPSIAKDGRILVPIRAVAEALDTEVFYNGNTKTVVIH